MDYVAKAAPTDAQHLAQTVKKLEHGFDPPRPFLIWALGSSYTNMLRVGEPWKETITRRFPRAPEITYEQMVGNSCPWQCLRGWARHLAVPSQPDLVITYTNGNAADLEKFIIQIRSSTIAHIRKPERFSYDVQRSVLGEISFNGEAGDRFVTRLVQALLNHEYTLELIPTQPGESTIERLNVFRPPMRKP